MALIVVIDDEMIIRDSLRRVLERGGHAVVEFPDAAPALPSPDLENADVVVTDLLMPTPAEVLIRYLETLPEPPAVIVMSGYLTADEWKKLGGLGASHFVKKPLSIQQLAVAVDQCVAARHGAGGTQGAEA